MMSVHTKVRMLKLDSQLHWRSASDTGPRARASCAPFRLPPLGSCACLGPTSRLRQTGRCVPMRRSGGHRCSCAARPRPRLPNPDRRLAASWSRTSFPWRRASQSRCRPRRGACASCAPVQSRLAHLDPDPDPDPGPGACRPGGPPDPRSLAVPEAAVPLLSGWLIVARRLPLAGAPPQPARGPGRRPRRAAPARRCRCYIHSMTFCRGDGYRMGQ